MLCVCVGGVLGCLSGFEALLPLICHPSRASHAVQCASAHEQGDVTAQQPVQWEGPCGWDVGANRVCKCKFIKEHVFAW